MWNIDFGAPQFPVPRNSRLRIPISHPMEKKGLSYWETNRAHQKMLVVSHAIYDIIFINWKPAYS